MFRKFALVVVFLLSAVLISSCAPLASSTSSFKPTTVQTTTPSSIPATTPTETLTPSPTATKTATPTNTPTQTSTATATATETPISPDQLALELGWETNNGPFTIQKVPGGEVLINDDLGVMGLKYEGEWYSTKSYFSGLEVVRPWVYGNRNNSMPSYSVYGHYAGLVEEPFPIIGRDDNKLGECVMAFRMLYLDNVHDQRLDMVNVCIASKLVTGDTVVHISYWDLFETTGFYDIELLRNYFKPLVDASLGKASSDKNGVTTEFAENYNGMAAYFKPSLESFLETEKWTKNQYRVFIMSMEAAEAQGGGVRKMLEEGNFPMDRILVPIQISIDPNT